MKKVLSVALAVVMLFAVCVPAFAANPITDKTEQTGTTIVKTSTKTETGEDGRRYGHNDMALTEDASIKLPYTLEGVLAYTSETPVVNPAVSNLLTLSIAQADWANAIVGEYSDTLTFTATVV